MSTTSLLRRTPVRILLGVSAVIAATVALPGAAQAHVTIQPDTTPGGDFSVVAFRVPNERDTASTTKLSVILPKEQPLGSVQTTQVPGWSVTTTTRRLAQPIDMFGEKLDTVVSRVTWTASGDGIRPDQYQDFSLSLGVLPATGTLQFKALQTYSNGEQVSWNEVSNDPSVEPEHPAPVLTLTAAAPEQGTSTDPSTGTAGSTDVTSTDQTGDATGTAASETGSDSVLPLVLSGAALVLAALAALLAWQRGGRARPDLQAGPVRRPEDANV